MKLFFVMGTVFTYIVKPGILLGSVFGDLDAFLARLWNISWDLEMKKKNGEKE